MRKIGLWYLPVDKLRPSPFEARVRYDERELASLAESIKRCAGVIQPVTVRWKNGYYEIACGHRRWLAAKMLSHRNIPAIVCEISDMEMIELALAENLHHQDFHPLEEAKLVTVLNERGKKSYKVIAETIGTSISTN